MLGPEYLSGHNLQRCPAERVGERGYGDDKLTEIDNLLERQGEWGSGEYGDDRCTH